MRRPRGKTIKTDYTFVSVDVWERHDPKTASFPFMARLTTDPRTHERPWDYEYLTPAQARDLGSWLIRYADWMGRRAIEHNATEKGRP